MSELYIKPAMNDPAKKKKKNGQMCYQNFALRTPQEFQSIF